LHKSSELHIGVTIKIYKFCFELWSCDVYYAKSMAKTVPSRLYHSASVSVHTQSVLAKKKAKYKWSKDNEIKYQFKIFSKWISDCSLPFKRSECEGFCVSGRDMFNRHVVCKANCFWFTNKFNWSFISIVEWREPRRNNPSMKWKQTIEVLWFRTNNY
jgi:hypothetical protein